MNTVRGGFTLAEMSVMIALLTILMPVLGTLTVQVLHQQAVLRELPSDAFAFDSISLRLRAEADTNRSGNEIRNNHLHLGNQVWSCEQSMLRRNDCVMYPGCSWILTQSAGEIQIIVTLRNGAERDIRIAK